MRVLNSSAFQFFIVLVATVLFIGAIFFYINSFVIRNKSHYSFNIDTRYGSLKFSILSKLNNYTLFTKPRLIIDATYVTFVRPILRAVFKHSSISTVLGSILVTYTTYYFTEQNTVATITAFYASVIFLREFFSDIPILSLIISPGQQFPNISNKESRIRTGVVVGNFGDKEAINVETKFRVYNKSGKPLGPWIGVERNDWTNEIYDPSKIKSLKPGETTENHSITYSIYDEFQEEKSVTIEPDVVSENHGEYNVYKLIEGEISEPIYVKIKTTGSLPFPLLSDVKYIMFDYPDRYKIEKEW